VKAEGECCPKCLSEFSFASLNILTDFFSHSEPCYFNKKDYDHGDNHITGCSNCTCDDGSVKCVSIVCPTLLCPEIKQLSVADECCKFCQGE
jgi:von Willebrand factor type C domain